VAFCRGRAYSARAKISTVNSPERKREETLLESFAALVAWAGDGQPLADAALDILLSLTKSRSAAIFRVDNEELQLFASCRADQASLDTAAALWAATAAALRRGETVTVTNRARDERCETCLAGPASILMLPIIDASLLVGLLYLDADGVEFFGPPQCVRAEKLRPVLLKALVGCLSRASTPRRDATWGYSVRTAVLALLHPHSLTRRRPP
jgi:hypothetical protein